MAGASAGTVAEASIEVGGNRLTWVLGTGARRAGVPFAQAAMTPSSAAMATAINVLDNAFPAGLLRYLGSLHPRYEAPALPIASKG